MSYTAIENNNIFVDLTQVAVDTGWTIDGTEATHVVCNDGNLYLLNFPLEIGKTYKYSYIINYINNGYVKASLGSNQISSGLIVETGVATSTQFYFYSNANCQIDNFVIEEIVQNVGNLSQNTISFNENLGKWNSFYTYIPESAFSMFTKTFHFDSGNVYVQENGSSLRCNFFGTQYVSTIFFTTNQQPTFPKTFQAINYQANNLWITPPSGITTANGQTSELINQDFLQMELADGISPSLFFYEVEGIYKANFLRDISDIINGDILQGNWANIGLQTTSPSIPNVLFSVEIDYIRSFSNTR